MNKFLHKAVTAFRYATSPVRMWPDFIVIGAQKCGTTSLYQYMAHHPNIVPATRKEIHYFDTYFAKHELWYKAQFPSVPYQHYKANFRKETFITGEASPYYMFHPLAPHRLRKKLPDVKLIALLRDPVARAYSQYQDSIKHGWETLSFADAISSESERLRGEKQRMISDPNYRSFPYLRYSYLAKGIYVDQLQTWMQLFPRDQFLILSFEQFCQDTASTFASVLDFLGLPSWEPREFSIFNEGSYEPMSPETHNRLVEYFAPYNRQLYQFLGVDFGWDST